MGQVLGIGTGGTISGFGLGAGGSAALLYDTGNGDYGILVTPEAGVVTPISLTLDVIIGGKNPDGSPRTMNDFTGPGYQVSGAFGAQAGLVFNSSGQVIGVVTGLGLGAQATTGNGFLITGDAIGAAAGAIRDAIANAIADAAAGLIGGLLDSFNIPDPGSWFPRDPLIIDLDGNGVDLTSLQSSTAYFDFGGDGTREKTGWFGKNDGVLVRDLDGDGQIENLQELLASPTQDVITTLRGLDTNADSKITSADSVWSSLQVWKDANGNGLTDAGELLSLSSLQLTEINLNAQNSNTVVAGNQVAKTTTVTLAGVQQAASVTFFATDLANTQFQPPAGYVRNPDTFALPELRGTGVVPTLSYSMSTNQALLDMAKLIVVGAGTKSFATLRGEVEQLVTQWAFSVAKVGIPTIVDDAVNPIVINRSHVEVLQQFGGSAITATVNDNNYMRLETNYQELINKYTALFATQSFTSAFVLFMTGNQQAQQINFNAHSFRFLNEIGVDLQSNTIGFDTAQLAARLLGQVVADFGPNATISNFTQNASVANTLAIVNALIDEVPFQFATQTLENAAALAQSDIPKLIALKYLMAGGLASDIVMQDSAITLAGNQIVAIGGLGSNSITGTTAANIIIGGGGADTLTGLAGNDTYIYNNGDGADTIVENAFYQGTADKLAFTGHSFAELKVARSTTNEDLILTFTNNTDQITIKDGALSTAERGVEVFGFTGGVTKTSADIRALAITQKQTTGADVIKGFEDVADTFTGGLGADTLTGLSGSDTYIYNNGDGADTIVENGLYQGTADTLTFTGHTFAQLKAARSATNNDLILTFTNNTDQVTITDGALATAERGIENFGFTGSVTKTIADIRALAITQKQTTGADTIKGFSDVADVFTGGLGADILTGLSGSDTYIYNNGDGADTIVENGLYEGTADRLNFTGHTFAELKAARSATNEDIILTFTNNTDQVTIADGAMATAERGIESFGFSGSVTKTIADIRALAIAQKQTTGADVIKGFNDVADNFTGGLGADTLTGLSGNDTYVYNNGDGADTIVENGLYEGTADKLNFTGHAFSELKATRSLTNDDMVLTFTNNTDKVTIAGGSLATVERGVESYGFTGGVTKTIAEIMALSITQKQTAAADVIKGFESSADTFTGGLGADTLTGLSGNDTYVYNNGDGADIIVENDLYQGTADRLNFTGHSFAELKVARSLTNDDLVLTFTNNTDKITIAAGSLTTVERGVESFGFTGAVTKTIAELGALSIIQKQTTGADTIKGYDMWADTFVGGAGNDTLTGLGGNDTFVFAAGFGKDTITDFSAGTGATDVMRLLLGTSFDTFAEVMAAATQVSTNTVITISALDTITLTGITKTLLVADDFAFV
jgi:Ca2+-binding RTX toxin-like protein